MYMAYITNNPPYPDTNAAVRHGQRHIVSFYLKNSSRLFRFSAIAEAFFDMTVACVYRVVDDLAVAGTAQDGVCLTGEVRSSKQRISDQLP